MFELAQPWTLLLLCIPFLSTLFKTNTALPIALKVPFFDTISPLVEKNPIISVNKSSWKLFFLIWTLIVIALAGPRWVGAPVALNREGHNIIMALDLSGSMALDDMALNGRPVSRLLVVKQTAEQFVKARTTDKIGLILFGTRAYLQTPLTYDHHNISQRLQDATVGLAGNTTSIGDALGLAVKHLQNVPDESRIVILLTDGANNSGVLTPLKAADLAKTNHIKVYTIGLGSDVNTLSFNGMAIGSNAANDLDETTLQKVANKTGGRYFRATDPHSLAAIYEKINLLETVTQEQAFVRPQQEYYFWFLGPACLLLLYWLFSTAYQAWYQCQSETV